MSTDAERHVARFTTKGKLGRVVKCLSASDQDVRRVALRHLLWPYWAKPRKERQQYVLEVSVPSSTHQAGEEIAELCLEPVVAYLREHPEDIREVVAIAAGRAPYTGRTSDDTSLANHGEMRGALAALLALDSLAVDQLISTLADDHVNVSAEAAFVLGMIGDGRAFIPLVEALQDTRLHHMTYPVPEAAAEALGKLGNPAAVEPLINVLGNTTFEVKTRTVSSKAIEALVRLGRVAVKPLVATLSDKDWEVRRNSIQALGQLGDPEAVEPLIAALQDESADVREMVADALGGLGDIRAVEPLIAALQDESADVSVVEALGALRDSRAVEPLIAALQRYGLADEVAEALGKLGDQRAVRPLISLLESQSSLSQKAALSALYEIGGSEAEEAIDDYRAQRGY